MNKSVGILTAVSILLASTSALGQEAWSVPPFADELPTTTAICVWSDDAGELADRWQKTPFFQIYTIDSMRPFWDDVRRKRGGLLPNEQLGLGWDDFVAVAAGGWVLTYDVAPDSPGTLLLADVAGREDAAASALIRVQQRWKEGGMAVQTEQYPWGRMLVGKGSGPNRFAFIHGSRLCLTDQLRLAKHIIAVRGGAGGALPASTEIGKAIGSVAKSAPRGSLQFVVDPWRLARDAAGTSSPENASRVAFFERHGFSAIQAILGYIVFHEGTNDAEFVVNVPVRFPLMDAAGMLSFATSKDFATSPLVPPDAVGVSCFQWDVRRAFQAYGFVYDDVYGENYAGAFDDLINNLTEDPDGPRVDLRAELIDVLRTKVTRVYDFGGARTKSNPSGRRELWMAESADPGKAARAIARFFDGDPDVTSSQVNDIRIWHPRSDTPWLGGEPGNPLPFSVDALCIMQGHLVLATDRQALRKLAGEAQPNAKPLTLPMWQATSDVPGIALSWRNLVEVGRYLHGRISANEPPSSGSWEEWLLWYLLSSKTEHVRKWDIDGTRLPAFSAIQDHFGLELIEASADQQGWRLRGRLARPATR
jgi:hypothetical protein